jgi:soluble lytic murein transglycosylase-like protein
LFDPHLNVRLGVLYLSSLLNQFGDLRYALAAYQYGPVRVSLVRRGESEEPICFWKYTNSVLSAYRRLSRQARTIAVEGLESEG